MYNLLRSILFLFDAEKVHYFAMNVLKAFCRLPFTHKLISNYYTPKQKKEIELLGLKFRNHIGLGAGFDKNAKYLNELEALGFGFVEIGTVTPKLQIGNDKPRLLRLKKDKALINRMGFNNDGATVIAERLKQWKNKNNKIKNIVIGGNIGKNKNTPNDEAWSDYVICFEVLYNYVDYFVVNVSSPNTLGLRDLQEKESLRLIFIKLEIANLKFKKKKPILLKIAPDLSLEQIDDIIDLVLEINIEGLVVSNTTLDRSVLSEESKLISDEFEAGGLSGKPIAKKANELIKYISEKSNNKILIIGSGGIFTKQDAIEKQMAGASLLQVWTGFIYEGPSIVKKIC